MILTLILTLFLTLSYPYPFSTPDPDPNSNCNSNPNSYPNPNPDPKPNPNSAGLVIFFFLIWTREWKNLHWGLQNLWTTEKLTLRLTCILLVGSEESAMTGIRTWSDQQYTRNPSHL